jgi:signal transduction histidine kinase
LDICRKLYIDDTRNSNYQFIVDIKSNVIIEADEYYIKQTLDNLIINALTYCHKGVIRLKLIKEDKSAKFSITDQGIGIPKEEIYDIFNSFTVSSKTRTMAGGRGIGLALCKRVLEMHKGSIWANNKDDETIFTFSIPLVFDDLIREPTIEIITIAKKLLNNGLNLKLISEVTGMKKSQIKALLM